MAEQVAAIHAEGVLVRRGGRVVLDHLDLCVPAGAVVGLLGANGAGKSTLLRCCAGLLPRDGGDLLVAGHDPAVEPQTVRRAIGWMGDHPALEDDLRLSECLHLAASLRGLRGRARHEAVAEALQRVQLADRARHLVGTLSRGQRARLALAEAIVHRPPLLLLDEPSAGLDPAQSLALRQLLRALSGRHAVLVATHQLAELPGLCDQVLVLAQGRIRYAGPPEGLDGGAGLEQGYLALAGAGAET